MQSPVPNTCFEEEPPLTKEEQEADNLVSLMAEIKEMTKRNQEKDADGKGVSDEERRKNAEEMMFKLSAMMDIGLDEDDEDDEENQDGAGDIKEVWINWLAALNITKWQDGSADLRGAVRAG